MSARILKISDCGRDGFLCMTLKCDVHNEFFVRDLLADMFQQYFATIAGVLAMRDGKVEKVSILLVFRDDTFIDDFPKMGLVHNVK